jgi:hypothetical protein
MLGQVKEVSLLNTANLIEISAKASLKNSVILSSVPPWRDAVEGPSPDEA